MEDLLKNKLLWLCVGLFMFNMFVFVAGKVVVSKAADEVIQRLQKEYSPSPYGPGLDPDKVPPDAVQEKIYLEMKKMPTLPVMAQISEAVEWRDEWEQERGFSQAQ